MKHFYLVLSSIVFILLAGVNLIHATQTQSLSVVTPNGGECYSSGASVHITWSYSNVSGDVTLELWKGGTMVQTIATVSTTSSEYLWTIPSDFNTATNYKVKISNLQSVEDFSNEPFTIFNSEDSKVKPDFNNDGSADILWRNYSTGANQIWLMNGVTKQTDINLPVLDLNWVIGGTGDFNGDGNEDILFRKQTVGGDNIVWLLNDGVKIGEVILPVLSDTSWEIGSVTDFNKDGNPDILWRNQGDTGVNKIWLMNGNVKSSEVSLPTISDTRWVVGTCADFNNDGNVDILWHHHGGSGEGLIWYMKGVVKNRCYYNYIKVVRDLAWEMGCSADYNGDGKVDILWRQLGSNGFYYLWFMNNNIKTGSHVITIPARPEPEWRIYNKFPRTTGFNEITAPDINIATPARDDSVNMGSTVNITWTSSNNVGANVKIEIDYFNDEMWNENTKSVIATNVPNTGTYSWAVGNGYQQNKVYVIKITDTASGARGYSYWFYMQ